MRYVLLICLRFVQTESTREVITSPGLGLPEVEVLFVRPVVPPSLTAVDVAAQRVDRIVVVCAHVCIRGASGSSAEQNSANGL